MNLKDTRENYYALSGKASDVVRQLGFAGIALVWIFKTDQGGKLSVPQEFFLPALFIVIGLACDLLQYLCGTAMWGIFNRMKERRGVGEDASFSAPPWINWPALVFFWSKMALVAVAYLFLICILFRRLG